MTNTAFSLMNNPVVWSILVLALFCYSVLLLLLSRPVSSMQDIARYQQWTDTLQTLVSALPLLGLLGTIVGLLQTFRQMSLGTMDQQALLSSGIADAMFTTEIGLVMVIPALLLLVRLKRRQLDYVLFEQSPGEVSHASTT